MGTRSTLPPITKTYGNTIVGGDWNRTRRECWSAATNDGAWGFDRLEEAGTPWVATHLPTKTEIGWFGSLRGARQSAAATTDDDLARIRAEKEASRWPSKRS